MRVLKIGGVGLCLTLLIAPVPALCQQAVGAEAPLTIPLEALKWRIVDARFVKELEGVGGTRFVESQPEQYRGLVLTVEIAKPAGLELTLPVADLALHYRFGEKSDVAPCSGASTFSTEMESDRLMNLSRTGFVKVKTGPATTRAKLVYVDLFFQNLEPETSELYLLVARPVGASFRTEGWKR